MKFYGRVLSSTSKNWLNFGGDLGIVRWVNEQKTTILVEAYPDRGEGKHANILIDLSESFWIWTHLPSLN